MTVLLLAALTAFAPAEAAEFRSAEEVLAQFKNEPTISEVQAMVLEYSKTDAHYVDAWMSAAKTAAALPELTLSYGYDNGYGNDYDYVADAQTLTGASADIKDSIDVRAKWNLDKLIMSSERIRVINEAQDVVKLRDEGRDEVARL